jgi:hypothetical protein
MRRKKKNRAKDKARNIAKKFKANVRDETKLIWVHCKFQDETCKSVNGTPCPHTFPHEIYDSPDLGPTDICSGECMKDITTWCVKCSQLTYNG